MRAVKYLTGPINGRTMKQDLVFQNDEGEFLKLCVDVTVYWKGTVFGRVQGVLDFYAQALSVIRNDVKYYVTETMEGARKIRGNTFESVPFWFAEGTKKRGLYIFILEGGEKADTISDVGFYLHADEEVEDKCGALRLILPVSYVEHPQKLVEIAKSLVRNLDFQSGHAGFAVNWHPTADSADDALSVFPTIARRYPGIDLSDINMTLYAIRSAGGAGIKCINWLTLLGSELTMAIGGIAALNAQLPSDCPVHPLGKGGCLIQAGERPDVGDRNLNAFLPSYGAVGRLMAPLRLTNHPEFIGSTSIAPDEDLTAEWLARFD